MQTYLDRLIAVPESREPPFLDGCDGIINYLDGDQKAVALSRDGFDKSGVFGFVLQCRAEFFQGGIEAAVEIDVRSFRPEGLSTLLPRYNLARLLQKQR